MKIKMQNIIIISSNTSSMLICITNLKPFWSGEYDEEAEPEGDDKRQVPQQETWIYHLIRSRVGMDRISNWPDTDFLDTLDLVLDHAREDTAFDIQSNIIKGRVYRGKLF